MSREKVLCEIEDAVKQISKKEDFDEYKIKIEGQTGKSDGYLGDIIFFRITKSNGEVSHFVWKSAKKNELLRKNLSAHLSYEREVSMYSQVFPALTDFLEKKNLHGFLNFVPKAWFTSSIVNSENIILDDLKQQNFVLWNKHKPMNYSHIKLVFENYGKWHGLSMAYKDQDPVGFSNLINKWIEVRGVLQEELGVVDLFKNMMKKNIEILTKKGRCDLANIYSDLYDQIGYIISRKGEKKDFVCITHGDCWINNYMFKYANSEDTIPQEMRFIDFQLSAFDTPVVDLSAFFYNVADQNSYHNFENLLTAYHSSLSSTMKALGSDPEKLFSMRDLRIHWRKYGFLGVLHTFVLMRVQLCEPDEAPDLTMLSEAGKSMIGSFSFSIRDEKNHDERILNAVMHFGEFLKFNRSNE